MLIWTDLLSIVLGPPTSQIRKEVFAKCPVNCKVIRSRVSNRMYPLQLSITKIVVRVRYQLIQTRHYYDYNVNPPPPPPLHSRGILLKIANDTNNSNEKRPAIEK